MGLKDKIVGLINERKEKKDYYKQLLAAERVKARAAAEEANLSRLKAKAQKKAAFEVLPARERARVRLNQAGTYLDKTKGVINKVNTKLESVGKKFNDPSGFGGQNQSINTPSNLVGLQSSLGVNKKPVKSSSGRVVININR